jgi:hypothetical protein
MRLATALALLGLAACDPVISEAVDGGRLDSGAPPDAGRGVEDAGQRDGGAATEDAGAARDAGAREDAGRDAGATNDAGPRDAGDPFSTDRARFFGTSRCADAGLRLCDDFESGALDTARWAVTGGNAVALSTAQAARGSRALHITKVGNGAAFIRNASAFPMPGDRYFGRAFFRFVSMPAAPMTYAHWTVLASSGTVVAGEIRVGGQFQNGKNLLGVGTDNRTQDAGTGDWTTNDRDFGPQPIPLDTWLCLEWLHDGTADETRVWWDGVEHPSLHTTLTVHGGIQATPYVLPTFTNVWLGWAEYQPSTQTYELWVDEVALDPQRIGCVR